MAVWDPGQDRGKPLCRLLYERYCNVSAAWRVFVYAAWRLLLSGKGNRE
jgi:hypothetical protein